MNIYANANKVPEGVKRYLTEGKEYLVMEDCGGLFAIVNDLGEVIHCVWDGCAHLDMGNWERIEKEGTVE